MYLHREYNYRDYNTSDIITSRLYRFKSKMLGQLYRSQSLTLKSVFYMINLLSKCLESQLLAMYQHTSYNYVVPNNVCVLIFVNIGFACTRF